MGNKQPGVAPEEAQGKYVHSLLDDLRQQVDQLNVEKGQLSERTSRLRGERDVLLEHKGQLQQRVEQLEERIRYYKRHEHKLLEENKQLQLEGDEEKLKELSQVYQQLQRVLHLLHKLNKQVQQSAKQRPQEAHQLVQQLQEVVEEIQNELLVRCGVESEKMEKLALSRSQNSPSTPTDTSEMAATGQHQHWWNSSPPPPPPPHPTRKAPPPPSYRATFPQVPYPPPSLPLRRQLHSQPPLHFHQGRSLAMAPDRYYNMAVSTGNLLSQTQQLARGYSQEVPLSQGHRVHYGSVHQV